jgi:hypothetical protein
MTNRFQTFQPSAFERVEKHRLYGSMVAGTPPRTATLQLPNYGVYDWFVMAMYGNPQTAAILSGRTAWFKNDGTDGSGPTANTILKTWTYGATAFASGAAPNDLSGLTVSDPDAAGLLTLTASWTTVATSRTIDYNFNYSMLFDRMDFRKAN